MKLLILIALLSASFTAIGQKVGIGTTNPLSILHVEGDIRTDSLLFDHPTSNDELFSFQVADVLAFAENRHSHLTANVSGPLWQTFTSVVTDTLSFISVFFNGLSTSDSLWVYEGIGTNGNLLDAVGFSSGSGWVQTPELNIPLTTGLSYTFAIDTAIYFSASQNTYDDGYINFNGNDIPGVSVTFVAYSISSQSTPIVIHGPLDTAGLFPHPVTNAKMNLNGTLSLKYLSMPSGAQDGSILTSDALGNASWKPTGWRYRPGATYIPDTNSFVGIGTPYPASKLHIVGPDAGLTVSNYNDPGPYYLMTLIGDGMVRYTKSNGEDRFVLDHDGNFGLGGQAHYDSRLNVHGKIRTENFQMQNGAQAGYVLTSDFIGNASWMPLNGTAYWSNSGNHIFSNVTGNVGIGTNNPATKLEVNGEGLFQGNLMTNSRLGVGTTIPFCKLHVSSNEFAPIAIFEADPSHDFSIVEIHRGPTLFTLGINGGYGFIGTNDATPMEIRTNNSTRIAVLGDGKVGIGTSAPSEILHVAGKTRTDQFQLTTGAQSGYVLSSADVNGNASWISPDQISHWNKVNNDVSLIPSGKVGIGTSGPLEKLHVVGKTRTDQFQMTTGAQAGYLLSATDINGNAAWVPAGSVSHWNKINNDIYLLPSGNVGVGNVIPAAKMHITKTTNSAGSNNFLLLENLGLGGAGVRYKNAFVLDFNWQTYVENDGKFKIGRESLADYLTILPDGLTGIGTNAPTYLLHLRKGFNTSGANDFLLIENSQSGGAGIRFKNTFTSTLWQMYVESNGKFTIGRHNVTEDITILEDGKVGIATNAPTANLDVNGSIHIKHSGSFVHTGVPAAGGDIIVTVPQLPAGWTFENTCVVVSNVDGAKCAITQSKLISLTEIRVSVGGGTGGATRFNYIIFKL